MTETYLDRSLEKRLEPKSAIALVSLFSRLREYPRPILEAKFSEPGALLDYFQRSCEACEELLTFYQLQVTETDKVRGDLERLRIDIQNLKGPGMAESAGNISISKHQDAILESLAGALSEAPDGDYLLISYQGKILGQAKSLPALAKILGDLRIPRSQIFVHRKGSNAAFRWA